MDEKRIAQLMKSLSCTREEAIEVLMDDDDVDHGVKKEWDLSEEQHKKAMKAANTGSRKSSATDKPKKVKENPTKEKIVQNIADFLQKSGYNGVEITNKTRMIAFSWENEQYEVTLIQKRAKK